MRPAGRGPDHAGRRQARQPRSRAGRGALRGQAGRRGELRPADRVARRHAAGGQEPEATMPRVILIDPDRTALAAMQAALAQGGFNDVLAVTSGSFALTMLERNRPDLIVSRVGVPDIDGYELCSIVRKDPLMTGVMFLLLARSGAEATATMPADTQDQLLVED